MSLAIPTQAPSDIPLDSYPWEMTWTGAAAPGGRQTAFPPPNTLRTYLLPTESADSAAKPVAPGVWVVFNALNDADAAVKLSTANMGRYYVPMGRPFPRNFHPSSPLTRIDVIPATGSNETVGFRVVGENGHKVS